MARPRSNVIHMHRRGRRPHPRPQSQITRQPLIVKFQVPTGGVNPDGTRWNITYTGPLGASSPVWQKTTTDLLGRTIRTERPGFSVPSVSSVVVLNILNIKE